MANSQIEYLNFDMFYRTYREKFKKPADSVVLFIHWFMIQNRYKCIVDNVQTEILPLHWNSCQEYYDFFYQRNDTKYRLEIYLIQSLMHIQLRRLTDICDSLLNITITDFLNEENYNDVDYKIAFRNLDKLFLRMQKCIGYTKEMLTPSTSIESIFNNDNNDVKINKIEITSKDELSNVNDLNYDVKLDSKVIEDEELKKKESQERLEKLKSTMKDCCIKLDDCFKSDLFINLSIIKKNRIRLTNEMKKALNLNINKNNDTIDTIDIIDDDNLPSSKHHHAVKRQRKNSARNQTLDSYILKSPANNTLPRNRNGKRKRSSDSSTSISTIKTTLEIKKIDNSLSTNEIDSSMEHDMSITAITNTTVNNGSLNKSETKKRSLIVDTIELFEEDDSFLNGIDKIKNLKINEAQNGNSNSKYKLKTEEIANYKENIQSGDENQIEKDLNKKKNNNFDIPLINNIDRKSLRSHRERNDSESSDIIIINELSSPSKNNKKDCPFNTLQLPFINSS